MIEHEHILLLNPKAAHENTCFVAISCWLLVFVYDDNMIMMFVAAVI
jgi:hypothetical protein